MCLFIGDLYSFIMLIALTFPIILVHLHSRATLHFKYSQVFINDGRCSIGFRTWQLFGHRY